ncbi:hypothetical protein D9758_003956 [Tetrapyrgos nigripes]|uniref:C2 domain-containing protein n=1 Tax=Tetrapyrgos nigripes TaxID=182062 RepID=A0A8H5GLU3_9AGAR|nr:hypothetical protein D9758_003956 [Tetrapyrgos nigripes]
MSKDEEIGTLIVVVLKARNLRDVHFYKQDAYARITFNGVTKHTRVEVKGGQHPVWDEEIRFPVMKNSGSKYRTLEASCWAKEHKDEDDVLLGEGKADMTDTLKSGEFDEWIPLSTNGTVRGDIYLEISFYSNGPAPVHLMPPAPNNLTRRPSKLKPADRLYRPPQPVTPPKKLDAALPPIPEPAGPVPGALKPGPKRPSPGHSPYQQPQNLPPSAERPPQAGAPVPAILRPGPSNRPPQSSNGPPHINYNSGPAPTSYPSYGPGPSGAGGPTPQNGYGAQQGPYASAPSYGPGPSGAGGPTPQNGYGAQQGPYASARPAPAASGYPPPHPHPHQQPSLWNSGDANAQYDSSTLSFPVPDFPAAPAVPYEDNHYQPPYRQPSAAPTSPHHYRTPSYPGQQLPGLPHPNNSTDLPDPYLIARYQSPLPLPPGAESHPHPHPPLHHHTSASAHVQGNSTTPTPTIPIPTPSPSGRSHTPIDENRLRQLRQAEQEAARRKEQEERDLELARQLDQELQQSEAPPAPVKTPSPVPAPAPPQPSAAEQARRRQQDQEEKDLELARQLDRELNLASVSGHGSERSSDTTPHMPGQW